MLPGATGSALASPQTQPHRLGQARPRRRMALGQQLDAGEMLGAKAELQQLEQVAAAAAADLDQAQRPEVGEAAPGEQGEHRPLPLLHRHQRRRVGEAIAVVGRRAAGVAGADRVGLGAVRSVVAAVRRSSAQPGEALAAASSPKHVEGADDRADAVGDVIGRDHRRQRASATASGCGASRSTATVIAPTAPA